MSQRISHQKPVSYPKFPIYSIEDLESRLLKVFENQNVQYCGTKLPNDWRVNLGIDFLRTNIEDPRIGFITYQDNDEVPIIQGLSPRYWTLKDKDIPQGLKFYNLDDKGRILIPNRLSKRLPNYESVHVYQGESTFL
ncbi:MAG: hypothetical protein ACMXYB_05085 [Candidatus Woesearchaeota archaeon]